jgi:hypothetical protein
MPTSTRRQAASRSQRYSEVSVGAPSSLHGEEAGQHEVHEDEQDDGESNGSGISVGEIDYEVFEGDGKYDARPETSTSD